MVVAATSVRALRHREQKRSTCVAWHALSGSSKLDGLKITQQFCFVYTLPLPLLLVYPCRMPFGIYSYGTILKIDCSMSARTKFMYIRGIALPSSQKSLANNNNNGSDSNTNFAQGFSTNSNDVVVVLYRDTLDECNWLMCGCVQDRNQFVNGFVPRILRFSIIFYQRRR